jgi:hypothetical protein
MYQCINDRLRAFTIYVYSAYCEKSSFDARKGRRGRVDNLGKLRADYDGLSSSSNDDITKDEAKRANQATAMTMGMRSSIFRCPAAEP